MAWVYVFLWQALSLVRSTNSIGEGGVTIIYYVGSGALLFIVTRTRQVCDDYRETISLEPVMLNLVLAITHFIF